MQNTNVKTLTISDPPQFGVIIERKDGDLEHSIFKDVYDEAFKRTADIIQSNDCNNSKGYCSYEEFSNTVISFVGKRGSGKSTAMCSFSSFLNENTFDHIKDENAKKVINKKHFHCLEAIDSVQLGNKETIIGRISAAMYKQYEDIINKKPSISIEQKREFIKQVQIVNKYAVMYHNGEWFKQNDNLLIDTYHVSMLRTEVQKLVETYLRLKSETFKIADDYLVVSIDDLDMGIENSYAIMEEIRKFLCIKNIIVLVTLRMDQVHIALRSKFEKQLDSKNEHSDNKILIDDLAYRYIEKLFPYSRQIQMPVLSLENLWNWNSDFGIKMPNEVEKTILPSVLHLIWRKTMIIPVCNSDGDHFLVPRNLRSLCNFVVFLRDLPDIDTDNPANDTIDLQNNLAAFSQYLVSNVRSYERGYISKEDRLFSEKLISIINNIEFTPLGKINSRIVGEILYFLNNKKSNFHHRKIFDKGERSFYFGETLLQASLENNCISLGDLMYVLGEIDSKTRCRYIKYLIEVIRTLWSIKMTEEYYCNSIKTSDTKFVLSPRFMNTVGKLIVNPDICFQEGKDRVFSEINDVAEEQKNKLSVLFGVHNSVADDRYWRAHCKNKEESNVITHPYASFTNVLNIVQNKPNLISDDEIRDSIQSLWLPLPFYSLDFMYRCYELSGDSSKINVLNDSNYIVHQRFLRIVKSLTTQNVYFAQESVLLLSKYITPTSTQQLIDNINKFMHITMVILGKNTDEDFLNDLEKCTDINALRELLNSTYLYELKPDEKDDIDRLKDLRENSTLNQLKDRIKEIMKKSNKNQNESELENKEQ